MKRIIMTFTAIASLALSVAGLALTGPGAPGAAAATATACNGHDYSIFSTVPTGGVFFDDIYAHGKGHLVTLSLTGSSNFEPVGCTGKWAELKDTANGDCLDLVGSTPTFNVNEENCNSRSAELWWIVSGIAKSTQIQNQYGTKLLKHDACMWNASTADLKVRKCVASQPAAQIWTFVA
jgi:hypothetical protein